MDSRGDSMTTDIDLKAAEARGYRKGYATGKKRLAKDQRQEAIYKKRQAFWQRAFLAALPAALEGQGWSRRGVAITTLKDRVRLAEEIADEALEVARAHLT